jgi:hypothetical protein
MSDTTTSIIKDLEHMRLDKKEAAKISKPTKLAVSANAIFSGVKDEDSHIISERHWDSAGNYAGEGVVKIAFWERGVTDRENGVFRLSLTCPQVLAMISAIASLTDQMRRKGTATFKDRQQEDGPVDTDAPPPYNEDDVFEFGLMGTEALIEHGLNRVLFCFRPSQGEPELWGFVMLVEDLLRARSILQSTLNQVPRDERLMGIIDVSSAMKVPSDPKKSGRQIEQSIPLTPELEQALRQAKAEEASAQAIELMAYRAAEERKAAEAAEAAATAATAEAAATAATAEAAATAATADDASGADSSVPADTSTAQDPGTESADPASSVSIG